METDVSSIATPAIWISDLIPVIARHLPPNVVSCTLRVVSKDASIILKHHTNVNLSVHIPEHAFSDRFSSPDALRQLSKRQRARLLTLTAASGSLANLRLLLRTTLRYLTGEDIPADISERPVWRALEDRGGLECKGLQEVIDAAAFAGHFEVCRWLLASGCPVNPARAACAATRGGHLGLMEELQEVTDRSVRAPDLVAAAAEGCGLPYLTRVYQLEGREGDLDAKDMAVILAAAAESPTSDWQAKVLWLEEQSQVQLTSIFMSKVTYTVAGSRLADSVERLAWLRDRGYSLADGENSAASAGNIPALTYLLDRRGARPFGLAPVFAAEAGQLAALQLLHTRGRLVNVQEVLRGALHGGHVAVVSWLVETLGVEDEQLRGLTGTAVRSCSLPLLRWLHERGCFQAGEDLVREGLYAGCSEEVLEWLVEHGCPVQLGLTAYSWINLAMLRCLERLGWHTPDEVLDTVLMCTVRAPLSGPTLQWLRDQGAMPHVITQETFLEWVRRGCSLCSLKWLTEEAGGDVDWQEALRVAVEAGGPMQWNNKVVQWIRGRLQGTQRQGPEQLGHPQST